MSAIEYEENLGRVDSVRVAKRQLVDNIREVGLINPITVEQIGKNRYRIVAGVQRYLALRELNEKFVRCSVRVFGSERDARTLALAENIHQGGLTLYEQTILVHGLVNKYDADPIDLSARLALDIRDVRAMIRAPDVLNPEQMLKFRRASISSPILAFRYLRAALVPNKVERDKAIDGGGSGGSGERPVKSSKKLSYHSIKKLHCFVADSGDEATLPHFRGQPLTPRERMLMLGLLELVIGERKVLFERPDAVLRYETVVKGSGETAVEERKYVWKGVGKGKKKPS